MGLNITGVLQKSDLLRWRYKGLEVTDIEVDVKRKSFEFYGKLTFFKDNPIYGKGFAGDVQLYAEDLGIELGARGLFGAVDDYRYWFVDGHGRPTRNNNKSLSIYDIGGGVYHHMRKSGVSQQSTSLSGINYTPDKNTSLGFKALAAFEIKNGATFTALAGVEIAFNSQSAGGGVSRVGFYGAAIMMQGNSENGNPQYPMGTVDEMQQTVSDKEATLINFHELSIDKEGIMYFMDNVFPTLLTGDELFACQIGFDLDFANRSYYAQLEARLNAGGNLKGSGSLTFYTSPTDWYIWVGDTNPVKRLKIENVPIGPIDATIEAYFLTGTQLPQVPTPPKEVIEILHLKGDELLFGRNFDSELAQGVGFAFGASLKIGKEFDWGIVYAKVEAKAGFDLMVRNFGDAYCVGKEGPIGMDGWYATGQMYAYLQGQIGAQVKLFGIRKRIPILSAGIAVLAQAQLPNPWFIKGYAGIDIKVLGVVNIHSRLKVIIGEECEIIGKSGLQDVVMISDITPRDGLTDVDVFDAVQVAFNAPINSEIPFEDEQGRKTFRIGLNEFSVLNAGNEIVGSIEYNNEMDVLIFSSDEILPPETEISVIVKVSFDEKIGGNWVPVTSDGLPVIEEKEVKFTTGDAPRKIPLRNIEYMYPIVDQQYMLPKESTTVFVQLDKGQQYLFGNGFSDELYFIDEGGVKTKANFSYNAAEKRLNFNIPDLDNEKKYTYALITLNPGDIEEDQVLSAVEFTQVSEDLQISNNTLVGNRNNGAFISRLDYMFKTSRYDNLKEKIRAIKPTKYFNFGVSDIATLAFENEINEPFDVNEIRATRYNNATPMIFGNALLNDRYYKNEIYPLIYEDYPLDSNIYVDRDVSIFDIPPTKSIVVSSIYQSYSVDRPDNILLKINFPFRWDLPRIYREDFYDIQYEITNRYLSGSSNSKNYNYIINARFPYINIETYEVKFQYILPNKVLGTKAVIGFKNDF